MNIAASGEADAYSDSVCETALGGGSVTIDAGQTTASFRLLDPVAENITLTGTDQSGALNTATLAVALEPSIAWIGVKSAPVYLNASGNAVPGNSDQRGSAGCSTTTQGTATPGWCTGGSAAQGGSNTRGFNAPNHITGDGTYLYVSDRNNHRVMRIVAATGACAGWLGKDTTTQCTGVTNSFTNGWCACGTGTAGSGNIGNGSLNGPAGLAIHGDHLYVNDSANNRLSKYNKNDGTFVGWVGILNDPTGATCSAVGTGNFSGGWCVGGTTQAGVCGTPNGGLNFYGGYSTGVYANTDHVYTAEYGCRRFSKFDRETGAYLGFVDATNTDWTQALTGDGDYLYGSGNYTPTMNRYVLSTGLFHSWFGRIWGGGGTCTAGNGNFSGGWCSGGTMKVGSVGGALADAGVGEGVMQVDASTTNLYVTDPGNHRINKYDKASGAFLGWIGAQSELRPMWRTTGTPSSGISMKIGTCCWVTLGEDSPVDNGTPLNSPAGVVKIGTSLWVMNSHKISRYSTVTGDFQGWYGAVGRTPTGGEAGCSSAPKWGMTPGFCQGGLSVFDNQVYTTDRAGLNRPTQAYYDGTYVYAVQSAYGILRVHKYEAATNTFMGWIGRLNSVAGASCAAVGTGNFTGGWCSEELRKAGLLPQWTGRSTTFTASREMEHPFTFLIRELTGSISTMQRLEYISAGLVTTILAQDARLRMPSMAAGVQPGLRAHPEPRAA